MANSLFSAIKTILKEARKKPSTSGRIYSGDPIQIRSGRKWRDVEVVGSGTAKVVGSGTQYWFWTNAVEGRFWQQDEGKTWRRK